MYSADPLRPRWRKSSRSIPNGECVELAWSSHGFGAIRDSKNPGGDILNVDMRSFIEDVKND